MSFFSIVIPAYNRSGFLVKTIESIQLQDFEDWECIVVDDGSTDDTRAVIETLIQKDSRIRYIYQNNAERSAARNTGIKNAQGDYVCFLDSVDAFLEKHLSHLYDDISKKKHPVAMFFTNYILSKNGVFTNQVFPSLGNDVFHYLCYNPIIPARVCIHRDILLKELFDEEIVIVEDLLLWIRIAVNYPLIHIEKETVVYNLHEDNSVNIGNQAALKRLNGLLIFEKKYKEIKKILKRKNWKYLIGDTHFNVMKYYLYKGYKYLAIKHLLLSIFYQKRHPQLKHKLYVCYKIMFNQSIKEYTY